MTFPGELPDEAFLLISDNTVARKYIRDMFNAVLNDRDDLLMSIFHEIERDGAMIAEVWAAVPNTFKQKIKALQFDEIKGNLSKRQGPHRRDS